jgi:hypothetical protein
MRFSMRSYLLTVGYAAAFLRIGEILITFFYPRLIGGN